MLRRIISVPSVPLTIDLAILILRVGTSLLMLTHGYDKLQSLLAGSTDFPDPLGLGPGFSLFLTVFAEFFCSILLIFGMLTRPALIFLMITMTVVVFIIHGNDGLEKQEHPLLFLIAYTALFITGPGRFSGDYAVFGRMMKR